TEALLNVNLAQRFPQRFVGCGNTPFPPDLLFRLTLKHLAIKSERLMIKLLRQSGSWQMADQGPTQVSLQVVETGAGQKLVQAGKITRYGNIERLHRRRMRRTQKANEVELRRVAVKFRQFRFVVEVGRIAPLHRAQ